MQMGEFFIKLSTKGAKQTKDEIQGITKEAKGLYSSSLATKAAIIGMFYGIQRVSAASAKFGTNLANFSALTGMSADALQRWQYMMGKVGVSAEETQSTITSLQAKFYELLQTGQGSAGFQVFADATKFDMSKIDDIEYFMGQLQKFSKMTASNAGEGNFFLRQLLGDNMIAGTRRNKMTSDQVPASLLRNDRQIAALDKVNAAWFNLGQKLSRSFDQINMKHGSQFVADVTKLTDSLIKLMNALATFSEKTGIIDKISEAINITATTLNPDSNASKTLTSGIIPQLTKGEMFGLPLGVAGSLGSAQYDSGPINVQINQTVNGGNPNNVLSATKAGVMSGMGKAGIVSPSEITKTAGKLLTGAQ